MEKANRLKLPYRLIAVSLAAFLGISGIASDLMAPEEVKASTGTKKLTIKTAINMALANSDELDDLDMQYETKQAELSSAIRSIEIKKRQMSSFTWSPLLSFHFPETPDEAEAYEFTYKPLDIQSEIDVLEHSMTDEEIEITTEVYTYFVDIYTLNEEIDYDTERLETAETQLAKNQARLALGQASESDVEKMETKVDDLTTAIADAKTSLAEKTRKFSKILGIDVTSGYTFQSPYVKAEIPRSELTDLIQYTLDHDQSYYSTCADTTLALTTLKTHYKLFCNHYKKGDMNIIRSYVTTAMNGNSINKKAFKTAYSTFITKIDSYWQGKFRVFLFLKLPRKLLKDEEEDGSGYIDEDPQVLYSASLDYLEKIEAQENAADELEENVRDSYTNYISAKKAYESAIEAAKSAKDDYIQAKALNQIGELTYEEYDSYATSYDDAEEEKLEALSSYSEILYSFNRLTCGRVMTYLYGTGIDLGSADGGTSYVSSEVEEGDAYYYIEPIIQESQFELHVYIPEDYPVEVTDFELWVGNLQVGTKTSIDDCIRHLKLDLSGSESIKIRLYNGDTFVDDCVIDGTVYSGTLDITASKDVVEAAEELGTYIAQQSSTTSLVSIAITPDDDYEDAAGFRIKDTNGTYLESEDITSFDSEFTYLPLLYNSLDKVIVEFTDDDGNTLAEGTFDTDSGIIYEYNGTD